MTQPTETPAAPPDPDPGAAPAAPHPRRSSHNKVIGGVCGGLGRYCDIDPVIFRVALGVLTVTGGLGLLFYGFGWLLLPLDDEEENEARRLLSGRVEGPALAAVLMALAGCGIFLSMLSNGSVMSFAWLLTLAVAGVGVWSQRRSLTPADAPPDLAGAPAAPGAASPAFGPGTA
ncbi:PspC domain-containing protein, partial [Streptomyces sp. YS-3]|uniref:PspC domain-containing protein n=1 Tax=Streptomyces sp. YS-3 TaxID=3381352 RepID=UPI003862806B